MPRNEEITVSYRVKIDERLKGVFELTGQFAYIERNERKSIDIRPVYVTIIPSEDIDPSLIVDVNDFERSVVPYIRPYTESMPNIAGIRQRPVPGNMGEYVVNILISKNNKQNFAKIEEIVPEGYTAVSLNPAEAIFTFKDQIAKFLWMNMPTDDYFTVSYRLIPKNQASLPPPELNGSFSYLDNDITLSVPIVDTDYDVIAMNSEQISELIKNLGQPVPSVTSPDSEITSDVQLARQAILDEEIQQATSADTEISRVNDEPYVEESISQRTIPATLPDTYKAYILEPERGVYYRIQLAAGHDPINITRYFRNLSLEKEVRSEEHEGWLKYSIGSFNEYKEARDYRIHVWNTTTVKDAFVTAYNEGQRITVQEALMITEQRWYQ